MKKMTRVLVNEVFFLDQQHSMVALRVTENAFNPAKQVELKTLMMGADCYRSAFPSGLYEGTRLMVRVDDNGTIESILPERWFPVTEKGKPLMVDEEELEKYDYHHDYA